GSTRDRENGTGPGSAGPGAGRRHAGTCRTGLGAREDVRFRSRSTALRVVRVPADGRGAYGAACRSGGAGFTSVRTRAAQRSGSSRGFAVDAARPLLADGEPGRAPPSPTCDRRPALVRPTVSALARLPSAPGGSA